MAATDDPIFLRLEGPTGREFRLTPARGKGFRRGKSETYVLGPAGDPDVNVAHPDLNDPTTAVLLADSIDRVALYKSMEPIPNVRGLGEMDDRVQIAAVSVELQCEGRPEPVHFERKQPFWLGLVCGLRIDLERAA